MGEEPSVLRLMLTAGLCVALGGAVVALCLLLIFRPGDSQIFSHSRKGLPRWTGYGVLAAVALFFFIQVGTGAIQSFLVQTGFFERMYGERFPRELPAEPTGLEKGAATVRHLWASTLAFPLALAAMIGLRRAMGVHSTTHLAAWPPGFVAGYLVWLIVTPLAFCVFVVASILHTSATGRDPEKHPLTVIGEIAGPWEWTLFVIQTVVIAPVIEEWLFRGVLLPWLAQKRPVPPVTAQTLGPRHRAWFVLLGALGVGLLFTLGNDLLARSEEVRQAFRENPLRACVSYLLPACFFLLLIPLGLFLPGMHQVRGYLKIRSRRDVLAIWASSALFAAMHASVWPSPIPLVVLSLGLGYLYLRTRSLVGPIVLHSLFNAVSALYLLLGGST